MLKGRFPLISYSKKFICCISYLNQSQYLNFRKLNVSRFPEQTVSMSSCKIFGEDEVFPPVYIISRIKGLPTAIKNLSNEICHGLRIREINVPDDSNILDSSCIEQLTDATVVICDPTIIAYNYKNLPKLEWAHCTWAGVEPVFGIMKEKPHFILTKHSHEDFSEQMAEYIMAQVLILEKNFRNIWAAETEKSWFKMKNFSNISQNRQIRNLTLGILGVGNMGQAIAKFFKLHGTKVIGLSRNARKSSEFGFFDKIDVLLADVLSSSDYIINTLPSTPETIGLLNGDTLQACTKMPVLINVGRGTIINESTLLKALENKWLSHAVLDVFQEEPLPTQSSLWNLPDQITITPHCAAISLPKIIANDFLTSFLTYQRKSPLKNVVDWVTGY